MPVERCDPDPPVHEHIWRVVVALFGAWKPEYQQGRKSKSKGYFGEIGHAAKNVVVEIFRKLGIWNRGNQDPEKCDGYDFPETLRPWRSFPWGGKTR